MNGSEHLPQPTDQATSEIDRLLMQLRATGAHLDSALQQSLIAQGDAVVPGLIALVQDENASAQDAPRRGWPPVHAVDLLVDLQAPAALPPLLDVVRAGELDDVLSTRVMVRLPEFGALAVEPLLDALARTNEASRRIALCEVLSQLGVREPRIWRALAANFDLSRALFASFLARYGDPRGAALIERALHEFDPEKDGLRELDDLLHAHGELHGEGSAELLERVETLLAQFEPAPALPAGRAKVGRNDPCPCGSGKKAKRCCHS